MGGFNNRHLDWRDTFGPGGSKAEDKHRGEHLKLASGQGNRTVRINVKTFSDTNATSGSIIGAQIKPRAGVESTGSVIGSETSSQVADAIAIANVIGAHVDAYVRGTTGNISGDVRGLQVELVTDDAGARTISGNVSGIRLRTAFSATAITGNFSAIRIEKNEVQTNSQSYDAVLELTSTLAGIWNNAPGTEPTTADGYIKVLVNGAARYIQLYSGAPVD